MGTTPQAFTQRQHMLRHHYEIYHYRNSDLQEVSLHHHDFYEIYLLMSGTVFYHVEGRSYQLFPGDILLVGPMELHKLHIDEVGAPYERMVLWLNQSFLKQLSTEHTDLTRCFNIDTPQHTNLLRLSPTQRAQVETLMAQLDEQSRLSETVYGNDICATSILSNLLVQLNRLANHQPRIYSDTAHGVVPDVLQYINTHYKENLSLDLLATKFFISKYHLSHEFGRHVGTSIYRYIMQKRLLIAKQLLGEGSAPSRVYQECGFRDYANFYRAFKAEYHISPKQFQGYLHQE